MSKGTGSIGKRRNKTHTLAFDAAVGASTSRRVDVPLVVSLPAVSENAIRRKTTGTGRMRYPRHVSVRFKSNFRQGSQAAPRKKGASASS